MLPPFGDKRLYVRQKKMKWSKVRKLVEETFADSVRDRVHIHTTAYRCSCGRGWLTVDGKEIANLSTLVSGMKYSAIYHESTKTICAKHPAVADDERTIGYLVEPGEFSRFDLHEACWRYLNEISLNDALVSENPLIVSLAVLNAKVGKTRLKKLAEQNLHPVAQALLEFRIKAERIAEP